MSVLKDALDISSWVILINWEQRAVVSGVSLNWKSPEDIVKVIWGSLRRRKQAEYDWSADNVVLYDNLKDLDILRNWVKFNIELTFVNTDRTDSTNLGQILVIQECTVNSHDITLSESSTFKMSWSCSGWTVTSKTDT